MTDSATPKSPTGSGPSTYDIGLLGELFVGRWLEQQGWRVIAHRWRCRWGELDLVACPASSQSALSMVEVKVRQHSAWDDGRLAITVRKRKKLARAAMLFLSEFPQWSDCACRFDLALVARKPSRQKPILRNVTPHSAKSKLVPSKDLVEHASSSALFSTVQSGKYNTERIPSCSFLKSLRAAQPFSLISHPSPHVVLRTDELWLREYIEDAFDLSTL